MSIIINTNISSMQGIRALNKSTGSLNQALERLSTGYRINSSKDDAACCAISASLRKDISSLTVAQSNAQMGQSMIDTANGSLSNISTLLQRMRDLTEQAANGTYGTDERSAMQNEIDNLMSEMNRAKNSTEFNGKQIFGKAITSEEDAIKQGYTVVKTAEELQTKLTTSADCKVMLFADIDLSELEEVDGSNWTAVGNASATFKGTLDGNGFTISNLKINKGDTDYQGLIGRANGATIKNVNLENAEVTGKSYVGALVGHLGNSSILSNCNSSGTVHGHDRVGGLAGYGFNYSTITDCSSSGTVIGDENYIGGLVGFIITYANMSNCSSSADVTGEGLYTAGLVGVSQSKATITNCNSSGIVTGKEYSAGLVGVNLDSLISNCESSATVFGTNQAGGLVGDNRTRGIITDCVSSSTVSGKSRVGGLVGFNQSESKITNCCASANVTGTGNEVGGLVGLNNSNNSTITNCSSSGTVVGNGESTGGLVGRNVINATITNCSSSSNVTGNNITGGLVGYNDVNSTISNSSSSGTVNGNNKVGGLVGSILNDSTISYSKTTSKVTGTSNVGAFVGHFWNANLEGNEYNSTINEGMRPVGGLTPTSEQIVDNKDLKIVDNSSIGTKGNIGVKGNVGSTLSGLAFGVGVDTTCNLQVGIKNDSDSTIQLDTGLAWGELNIDLSTETTARTALERIDTVMSKITNKQTELGAMSNRLMTAMEYQDVQKSANIATNSVIKDADFAKESSNYIKSQILQNTTASLLATANQNPSIALMLVTGTQNTTKRLI